MFFDQCEIVFIATKRQYFTRLWKPILYINVHVTSFKKC